MRVIDVMPMRTKIIIDDKVPFIRGVLEPYADVRYHAGADITPDVARDADMLIVRTRTRCDASLLAGSRCRFIGTATIGYDHIDTDYCRAAGIEWCNAPGCNATSVAQYITASLMCHAIERHIDLAQMCIGVVGVGHVGRQVEAQCRRLGMRVLLNDPPRAEKEGEAGFVSLDTIATQCDYITFHTPLVREGRWATCHLADEAFWGKLERRPVIINAARGAVVDNCALEKAYDAGLISDMIIDCWENEPAPLLSLMSKAFIATPHIAGYSADGKANAARMMVREVASRLGVNIDLSVIQPPMPPRPYIVPDNRVRPLYAAILATYNPLDDSGALKKNPEDFERLRGEYPLRREYAAYKVTTGENIAEFKEWGFGIG